MFDFINYGESALTLVFFLIALYVNKGSKNKFDFLSIITGLMFVYTLIGMPIVQKSKADENIASYKNGSSLSCTFGFLAFSSTFTLKENEWDLEENYFINKQTKESIRVDKCVSIQ
jgi:hypothetical protein